MDYRVSFDSFGHASKHYFGERRDAIKFAKRIQWNYRDVDVQQAQKAPPQQQGQRREGPRWLSVRW